MRTHELFRYTFFSLIRVLDGDSNYTKRKFKIGFELMM